MAKQLSASEIELRRWAVEAAHGDLRHARQLLDFVLGRSDQTPMERILDALSEAGLS